MLVAHPRLSGVKLAQSLTEPLRIGGHLIDFFVEEPGHGPQSGYQIPASYLGEAIRRLEVFNDIGKCSWCSGRIWHRDYSCLDKDGHGKTREQTVPNSGDSIPINSHELLDTVLPIGA